MNIQNNVVDFNGLPPEISTKIICNLPRVDLLRCMCVSKYFKEIAIEAHRNIARSMGINCENIASIRDLRKRITGMIHLPDLIKNRLERFNLEYFIYGFIKNSTSFDFPFEPREVDAKILLSSIKYKENSSAQLTACWMESSSTKPSKFYQTIYCFCNKKLIKNQLIYKI